MLIQIRKGRRTRDQIADICWIIRKAREFQKNIYFCFIDYAKAFDCVDHHKLWKILQEMGIPDHLTGLLKNLYAGQEATVRTGHGTTDSFSYLERVCCSMSSSNCCFMTCIQIFQKASKVVWYSHLLKNFPQFIVIHTVKGFGIVNKAEIDIFLELSCYFNDPQMLAI